MVNKTPPFSFQLNLSLTKCTKQEVPLVQIRIVCAPKFAFIFLPIILNMCLGAQKNRLIETVLLSTHNICFRLEIRKIIFQYTLLSGGLIRTCFLHSVFDVSKVSDGKLHEGILYNFRQYDAAWNLLVWPGSEFIFIEVNNSK